MDLYKFFIQHASKSNLCTFIISTEIKHEKLVFTININTEYFLNLLRAAEMENRMWKTELNLTHY